MKQDGLSTEDVAAIERLCGAQQKITDQLAQVIVGQTHVIEELLATREGMVLATGGGAVTQAENCEYLKSGGIVVYLKTSVDQQMLRTSRDQNRPLLQTDEPRRVLTELMAIREPLYLSVADHEVSTERGSVKDVAVQVAELVLNSKP